jgi:molybdopterin converting factor small subunit
LHKESIPAAAFGERMNVYVELYATLRKGRFVKASLNLNDRSTIGDLLAKLKITRDDVGILIVNKRDATFDQELFQGDKVTVIPPIGGG